MRFVAVITSAAVVGGDDYGIAKLSCGYKNVSKTVVNVVNGSVVAITCKAGAFTGCIGVTVVKEGEIGRGGVHVIDNGTRERVDRRLVVVLAAGVEGIVLYSVGIGRKVLESTPIVE